MLLPFPTCWLWLVQIPLHHKTNMENFIRNPQNCLSSRFCILSCHEFQVLWGWYSNHRGLQISHLETEINKPNKYSHDTSDRSNYPGGHDCILRGCVSHPNQWNWILHVSFVVGSHWQSERRRRCVRHLQVTELFQSPCFEFLSSGRQPVVGTVHEWW